MIPRIERGDSILEKNETRKDALDPKFKGPYKVLDVRDTRVKIQKGRKRRWIHINRCKQFTGGNNKCETTSSTYPIAASRPPLQATAPSAAGVSDEKEQDHDRELTSTQDVPLPPGAHEEGPQPEADNREIIVSRGGERRRGARRSGHLQRGRWQRGGRRASAFQRLGYPSPVPAFTAAPAVSAGGKVLRPLTVSINFVILFCIFWSPEPFSANFKTFADFGQICKTMWYLVIIIFSVLD